MLLFKDSLVLLLKLLKIFFLKVLKIIQRRQDTATEDGSAVKLSPVMEDGGDGR
jgi:hypothetical protein